MDDADLRRLREIVADALRAHGCDDVRVEHDDECVLFYDERFAHDVCVTVDGA